MSILVHYSNGTCLKCDLRDVIGREPPFIVDIECESVYRTDLNYFWNRQSSMFLSLVKDLAIGYLFYFATKVKSGSVSNSWKFEVGFRVDFERSESKIKIVLFICIFTVSHAMFQGLSEHYLKKKNKTSRNILHRGKMQRRCLAFAFNLSKST